MCPETNFSKKSKNKTYNDGGLRTKGHFKEHSKDVPLISVITVVFNSVETIETTIISVLEQNYQNIEYIIIDGGSSDGTLDIIKSYSDSIDYWVSGEDDGIYDAMNLGIGFASGGLIGILNAGDTYYQNTINTVAEKYKSLQGDVIITGAMDKQVSNGETVRMESSPNSLKKIKKIMSINHPSTFVGSSVYKRYGCFDAGYFIAGDYDFIKRAVKSGVKFTFVEEALTYMAYGGVSDNFNLKYYLSDRKQLIKNFPEDSMYVLYYSFSRLLKELRLLFLRKIKLFTS